MRAMPRKRTILGLAVCAQGALSILHQGIPVLGPALRDHYGLSLGETGALLSAASVGVLVATFAWGELADRRGERVVITLGLAGAVMVLLAAAAVPAFLLMGALLFLAGAFAAAGNAASGRVVFGWFAADQRGLATGIRLTATPLGGAVAALLLPAAYALGGLSAPFLVLATISALVACATAIWLRDPPATVAGGPRGRHPIRDRRVWRIAGSCAPIVALHIVASAFLVLYLDDEVGVPVWASAVAFGVTQVAGAAGRIAVGRWSDRRGRRIAPIHLLGAVAVVTGAAAALASLISPPAAAALIAVSAVVAMAATAVPQIATAELVGIERAGAAIGLQNTMFYVAVAASPRSSGGSSTRPPGRSRSPRSRPWRPSGRCRSRRCGGSSDSAREQGRKVAAVADRRSIQLEPGAQPVDLGPGRLDGLRCEAADFRVGCGYLQRSCGPIRPEVEAGDESPRAQQRQDVVAVDALRSRRVDLEAVAEAEDALGPRTVPDQGVEGREQRGSTEPCRESCVAVEVGGVLPALDAGGDEPFLGHQLLDSGPGDVGPEAVVVGEVGRRGDAERRGRPLHEDALPVGGGECRSAERLHRDHPLGDVVVTAKPMRCETVTSPIAKRCSRASLPSDHPHHGPLLVPGSLRPEVGSGPRARTSSRTASTYPGRSCASRAIRP